MTFFDNFLVNQPIPPPPPPPYEETINDASSWSATMTMTSRDALESLSDYIDDNCCWGRGPMKGMQIQKIEPTTAYKYLLTS